MHAMRKIRLLFSIFTTKSQSVFLRTSALLMIAAMSVFLIAGKAKAQFTSTWGLTATTLKTSAVAGVQAANIIAGDMVPGTNFATPGSHNTSGYECAQTIGNWPNVATDNYNIDFPISPVGSNDLTIAGVVFDGKTSNSSGDNLASLAYQVDGAGAWTSFGAPITIPSGGTTLGISFGTLTTTFVNGHTYKMRMYIYAAGTSTNSGRKVFIKNLILSGYTVPGGPPPSVLTTAASATGRTTATASGNITSPSTLGVTASGFCWDININPTIALSTKTTNGPTTGVYTHAILGLTAGTLYHVRAYATNAVGTSYGDDVTFTTDPAIVPVLTTSATSNINIFSATSGGNISDNGGSVISASGICWSTSPNPTIANSITTDGSLSGTFVSNITGLLPSTTYYVTAYATNAVGTGYGNPQTFTTPAPSPTLIISAAGTVLSFGSILQNTTSPTQTFSLTGFYLSPASGNITINAPAGFRVSLNSTTGFAPSIQLPYTGSALSSTIIYVRFAPTLVRDYNDSVRVVTTGSSMVYVNVTGTGLPVGLQSGQGFSNKGKEFWVGYGASEKMYGDNSQDLRFTFYNSNNAPATVTLSIPNHPTFAPVSYTVPANDAITTNAGDFPESGTDDARLVNEGVYTTGIKIVSDTPVVVYCHAITSSVYAASVLFPTPTLGKEYTSLNFNQRSNNSVGKSYLFVVATEDNTTIEVTLPTGVETDTHAAGSTFTQLLNKGEILNLFGKSIGHPNLYTGNDLSGTIVKSISTTGSCKPFAMYSGSSKITIDCDNGSSGSGDNLFQQMFPKQAWGNKVIAIPTLPLIHNHYRILVGDPLTVVKRNGVALTGIINNKYYEYYNDLGTVDILEGDKPIMVAQYMTTHGECNNAGSVGDPDMIYLSSIQQTIDTVSFVSSPLGTSGGRAHYLNVAIPTAGVSTFKLDGVLQSAAFAPLANDPSISYAQLSVAEGFHNINSTSGFNATAYGVANDESYGYNAGTNVKNLLTGFSLQNQFGTGTASNACRDNEFFVRVTLPYMPISITWDFAGNTNLSPNAAFIQSNPVPEDSFVVNNQTLYVFKNPTPYLFHAVGSLPVLVTVISPIPDGCNGEQKFSFNVNVIQSPTASFDLPVINGCLNPPIQFIDNSIGNGMTLDLYQWNFGDAGSGANNTSTLQSPTHTFSTGGTFVVSQRVITLEGCYDDSTSTIALSDKPAAVFNMPLTGCQGLPITFTNSSTITSGNISQWNWNFGDGSAVVNATNGNAQTHTFATTGPFTVSLTVVSSTGCTSDAVTHSIAISAIPTVTLNPLSSVCNNAASFALTGGSPATVSGVGTGVYSGTGVSNGIFDPLVSGSGTFPITYTYTTAAGCQNAATANIVVNPSLTLSVASLTAPVCINDAPKTMVPNVAGGVFAGPGVTGSSFNPSTAGVGAHAITYTLPGNPCSVPAAFTIDVHPNPTVDAGTSPVTISNGTSVTLTATASAGTYLWTPASALTSTSTLITIANPSSDITYTLTVTNTFGCKASDDVAITVLGPCLDPSPVFTPNNDGNYDVWVVSQGSCVKQLKVDVYNRWGGLVYHSDDYRNNWNGTCKNAALPDGTYYYVVSATLSTNKQVVLKGNVTIMR